MARYSIEDTTLTALGDAIRNKTGKHTKEVEVPLEPYAFSYDEATEGYEGFELGSLGFYDKQIYFPLVSGAVRYKIVVSKFTVGHSIDSATIYFRTVSGYSPGTGYSIPVGENNIGYMDVPNRDDLETIHISLNVFNISSRGDMSLDLTIYPINAAGDVIENEIKYVVNTMTPSTMAEAINDMAATLPDSAFNITGDCQYKFANGGWDWFVDLYGDKVTTSNISNCNYMFNNSKVENIPFDINVKNTTINFSNMFCQNIYLKEFPRIKMEPKITAIPTSKYNFIDLVFIFSNCESVRKIPDDYFDMWFDDMDAYYAAKANLKADGDGGLYKGMYSLRQTSPGLYRHFRSYGTGHTNSIFYQMHQNCYVLDETANLPVEAATYTSNAFNACFTACYRLSRIAFETNEDGTPKTANWKSQTIDLTGVGFVTSSYYRNLIINYNSGITVDKQVDSAETYAALKDDPDWFAYGEAWSRYNKTSAIETLNTLPDVKASGGTNTIKFKGAAGASTDGGAINTMTEEEIAVASAKGWTVTFA